MRVRNIPVVRTACPSPSTLVVGDSGRGSARQLEHGTMKLARSNPTDRFGRLLVIIVLTFIVSGIDQDWATSLARS